MGIDADGKNPSPAERLRPYYWLVWRLAKDRLDYMYKTYTNYTLEKDFRRYLRDLRGLIAVLEEMPPKEE